MNDNILLRTIHAKVLPVLPLYQNHKMNASDYLYYNTYSMHSTKSNDICIELNGINHHNSPNFNCSTFLLSYIQSNVYVKYSLYYNNYKLYINNNINNNFIQYIIQYDELNQIPLDEYFSTELVLSTNLNNVLINSKCIINLKNKLNMYSNEHFTISLNIFNNSCTKDIHSILNAFTNNL